MSKSTALLFVVFSGLCAAFSQVLLKTSAMREHKSPVFEIINWRVLTSYGILFLTTVINMYAMRFVEYKYIPVIGTVSYIFVVLLSNLILKEKIGRNKVLGMALILSGMLIFNL